MGRRPRFAGDQRAWITDQLLRSHEATRSREVWRGLYAAFLEQFPNACDVHGEAITLARYKAFVIYVERRQETQLVARAVAHLRRHELHENDQRALVGNRGTFLDGEHSEDGGMDNGEMVIKEEVCDQSDEDAGDEVMVVLPRPPVPLLRTRATATAIRADRDQQADAPPGPAKGSQPQLQHPQRFAGTQDTATDTTVPSVDSSALNSAPRKRSRVEPPLTQASASRSVTPTKQATSTVNVEHKRRSGQQQRDADTVSTTKKTALEAELERAKRDADKWKMKYETEKTTNDTLHARLNEALAALESQKKQLHGLEATMAAAPAVVPSSSSSSSATASALTFTISVNVDVSQNGQPLRTTSHALRLSADTVS